MDIDQIKQGVFSLKGVKFIRFEKWFYNYGRERIAKNAKSSKLRQGVLSLSDKDLELFWDWFDDLCDERWAEEVENDPMARQAIEIANIIMGSPDPDKIFAKLLGCGDEAKKKTK